jgi:hypothetical protein
MDRYMQIGVVVTMLVVTADLGAFDREALSEADRLYDDDRPRDAIGILDGLLADAREASERAEILWRLSRALFSVGEAMEDAGAEADAVLAAYAQGERYGAQAVLSDPACHLGYFWQGANTGRWGQAKGVLESLSRAAAMRDLLREAIRREPNHAASYHVLGRLYAQVPASISFGDIGSAVGLARKSVDLHEAELASGSYDRVEHEYRVELASHLIDRNWNARRRAREQDARRRAYHQTDDPCDHGRLYEGVAAIPATGDRQEAEALLRDTIRLLRDVPGRTAGEERQLARAIGMLEGL